LSKGEEGMTDKSYKELGRKKTKTD